MMHDQWNISFFKKWFVNSSTGYLSAYKVAVHFWRTRCLKIISIFFNSGIRGRAPDWHRWFIFDCIFWRYMGPFIIWTFSSSFAFSNSPRNWPFRETKWRSFCAFFPQNFTKGQFSSAEPVIFVEMNMRRTQLLTPLLREDKIGILWVNSQREQSSAKLAQHLWNKSTFRSCTDGAANFIMSLVK